MPGPGASELPRPPSLHREPAGARDVFRHYIRDIVYGANDGIITTFAVVAGGTGGELTTKAVIVVGIVSLGMMVSPGGRCAMLRRTGRLSTLVFALLSVALGAQTIAPAELATFEKRLGQYIEMHRRLEGPLPPLAATRDMDEVDRLMADLRRRITAERRTQGQGYLVPPGMIEVLRARIAGGLSPDAIGEAMIDIDEHTPPDLPPVRVNEPLPENAPFGLVPPDALKALPHLPPELRWVVLSKALLIWDHHADLVVDIAPGVFDASTYRKPGRVNP